MIETIFNFIFKLLGIKNNDNNEKKHEKNFWYAKKEIMTYTEKEFYKMFQSILGDKYIVWPQINLATIINRRGNRGYHQSELYRNVDFGIFSKEDLKLLLLIEINDETHNMYYKTRKRDKSVKQICYEAGYRIMTFWTNKPNEYYYVKDRLLEFLESDNTNNYFKLEDVVGKISE